MRVHRAQLGMAAAGLAVIGLLVPVSGAAAAPPAPVITSITTTSGGVDTASPAAGQTNAPIVEVSGVSERQWVRLFYTGLNPADAKVCLVRPGETKVRFNDLLSCPLSAFVVGVDETYTFTATTADTALPISEQSAPSAPFDYIRDNDPPLVPRGTVAGTPPTLGVEQLPGVDIEISFLSSTGDQSLPDPSGIELYQILRDDLGDADVAVVLGTVSESACPTNTTTPECTFVDTTAVDGHTYVYEVRAKDHAGNLSSAFSNDEPNPVSGEVIADAS